MSGIIYGVINRKGHALKQKQFSKMQDSLTTYKVDRFDEVYRKAAFMGCGLIEITPQNQREVLPLYDEKRGRLIVADVILDNRLELYEALEIDEVNGNKMSDSMLILAAYDKWGKGCAAYLVGDFAFVIWEEKTGEIYVARDCTGTRTFYYYLDEERFIFGTVIKPILAAYSKLRVVSRTWFTEFLGTMFILNQLNCEDTPYEAIKQLPPANWMIINEKINTKSKYWDPAKTVKPLKLPNERAYHEAFLEVFNEAVRCRLNTDHPIGILLSGGLDSGSVACLAAKALGTKSLEAFSSVPMVGFKTKEESYYVEDESSYIECISRAYPNVNLHYCRAEGKHALSDLAHVLEVFEYPYKMLDNMAWYRETLNQAALCQCKVLLNGQHGNNSISYGNFLTHALTLIHEFKYFELHKEIKAMAKHYGAKKRQVRGIVLRHACPYILKRVLLHHRTKHYDYFEDSLIKDEFKPTLKTLFLTERIKEYPKRNLDYKGMKPFRVNPITFTQIASMEVKAGLEKGIIMRDPTRDKRLIEFCLSLPSKIFVHDGMERRLIRMAMAGILPDEIRLSDKRRGLQGADAFERIAPNWQVYYDELQKIAEDPFIATYVDKERYKYELNTLSGEVTKKQWFKMKMFLMIYMSDKFWKQIIKKDIESQVG